MAGPISAVYKAILRKNSTFLPLVVVGAFFFERGVDVMSEQIFNNYNKGVSSLTDPHNQLLF
jgi:HKD family nuclease